MEEERAEEQLTVATSRESHLEGSRCQRSEVSSLALVNANEYV